MKKARRDPLVVVTLAVAAFGAVTLALTKPDAAIIPITLAAVALLVLYFRADRRPRRVQACQQCGRRFRGADMVEHHVNEHRVCDS